MSFCVNTTYDVIVIKLQGTIHLSVSHVGAYVRICRAISYEALAAAYVTSLCAVVVVAPAAGCCRCGTSQAGDDARTERNHRGTYRHNQCNHLVRDSLPGRSDVKIHCTQICNALCVILPCKSF